MRAILPCTGNNRTDRTYVRHSPAEDVIRIISARKANTSERTLCNRRWKR